MRWIGIIGIFAVLVTVSADAMDTKRPCSGLAEEKGNKVDLPAPSELPLLTDRQCEALKSRELRMPLLEIPQQEEDPMALSLGTKGDSATLHFKIPFSF